MQVILDSPFARPGSAPIGGGKKGEFRDWIRRGPDVGATFEIGAVNYGYFCTNCALAVKTNRGSNSWI